VYEKPTSFKKHQNEGTERLMIRNVPEFQEATQSEVVVEEVGSAAPEFLAAAPLIILLCAQ
jgi:hypothetical protein